MAIQFWSWIFIIQIMLVRPGYTKVGHYEVLARRALGPVFIRGLTESEVTTRNTFTALAITASVLLVVGLLGLFLVVRKHREEKTKVPEPESQAADVNAKPSWFMVDGKNEKMDWWRLSHRFEPTAAPAIDTSKPIEGGRIARLKAAIQRQSGRKQEPIIPMYRSNTPSPTDSLGLPMQTNVKVEPRYPASLERGYRAPIYPVQQSPPQLPEIYVGDKPLKRSPTSPPRALVTSGQRATLSRGTRSGVPRSPAVKRRDRLSRYAFRHPFLPLKASDAPLKISSPTPLAYIDTSNPKLTYAPSLTRPRPAPLPPTGPRGSYRPPVPPKFRKLGAPTPLNLLNLQDNRQPLSAARTRVGLPASPRPARGTNSAI